MLLETAAVLDRYDRAAEAQGQADSEAKREVLLKALTELAKSDRREDRAKTLLELFTEIPT